ncbi:G2/mitotic-specific cyclin C13-1-like protein [Tanacetum coccineum]
MYTKQEVVKMEAEVLKTLKIEMGNPTVKTFLGRFIRIAQEDYDVRVYAFDMIDLCAIACYVYDYGWNKFLPSMIAASVTFLAKFMLKPKSHPWNSALEQLSGYKPSDLKECVQILHDLQSSKRAGNLVAIREKYKQHKGARLGTPFSFSSSSNPNLGSLAALVWGATVGMCRPMEGSREILGSLYLGDKEEEEL